MTQLVLAIWHGTFIFFKDPFYGWYLSSTATLLFISYFVHNLVAWLKIRPFLPRWGSHVFIISLLCAQPFWIAESWSNFEYFNSLGSEANVRMRPWEALLRDPWWIFTTWMLVNSIKKTYGYKLWTLIQINSRFGVMLLCMTLSIIFLFTDVVVTAAKLTAKSGINPYWRFALVFKCASDTIFLDDFKSVLDDIVMRKYSTSTGNANRRNSVAKRSGSSPRNHSFMECSGLESPCQQPVLTTVTSKGSSTRKKFLSPIAWTRRESAPAIYVQDELPSPMSHIRESRSAGSAAQLSHTALAAREADRSSAYDSEGSLFNGRMV